MISDAKNWSTNQQLGKTTYQLFEMAKQAKTAIKTKDQKAAAEAKNWTKVIKAVRSPKTGAYTFKEAIIHKDKVKQFLAQK